MTKFGPMNERKIFAHEIYIFNCFWKIVEPFYIATNNE